MLGGPHRPHTPEYGPDGLSLWSWLSQAGWPSFPSGLLLYPSIERPPPPRPAQNIFILTAQIPIKPIRRLSSELATCRASLVSTQAGLSEGSVQDGQVLELVVPGDTG